MKKQSNWSILGYLFGISFSLISAVRYLLIFQDTDRALVYALIGFIICGISWLYDKQLAMRNTLTALEDYLQEKNEKKRMQKTIKRKRRNHNGKNKR